MSIRIVYQGGRQSGSTCLIKTLPAAIHVGLYQRGILNAWINMEAWHKMIVYQKVGGQWTRIMVSNE